MDNTQRRKKIVELERLALNLEYSFNRGVDLDNRIIRLTEDIEEHTFDWFDSAITALETINRKAITIRISSYGGDVYSALGIIGRMQNSSVSKINTEGYGKIMSAATAVLAAGDKRSMSKLAEFMHHESSYGVEGRHSEIVHEVKVSERLSLKWARLMSELTGIPQEYWLRKGVGKDFYISADDCLELNIVDEIF
jgi:ATP-dependent protease ClpP protease subunit